MKQGIQEYKLDLGIKKEILAKTSGPLYKKGKSEIPRELDCLGIFYRALSAKLPIFPSIANPQKPYKCT